MEFCGQRFADREMGMKFCGQKFADEDLRQRIWCGFLAFAVRIGANFWPLWCGLVRIFVSGWCASSGPVPYFAVWVRCRFGAGSVQVRLRAGAGRVQVCGGRPSDACREKIELACRGADRPCPAELSVESERGSAGTVSREHSSAGVGES